MTSEALRFTFNHLLKQWVARVKERKKEMQKFEYLEIEKSFLDEVKGIVHNFLRAIVWQKKTKACCIFVLYSCIFLQKSVWKAFYPHVTAWDQPRKLDYTNRFNSSIISC